jgi:hypothetical protein
MELIGLIFGFWLFIFSKMYREAWIHEYQKSHLIFKFIQILSAVVSIAIGLAVPIYVIYLIF